MFEREISKALDDLWLKSAERNWIIGRLGVKNGAGYDIDVPGRAGFVYVSLGVNGERGQATAQDKVGVASVGFTLLKMRRENDQLVIREADNLAGGAGGGVDELSLLTDVALTSIADGHVLEWDTTSSKWINVVPSGGAGGAPSPHDRAGVHHSGLEAWANIDKTGSNLSDIATRSHTALQDIGANDHHNQIHVLATGTALGADHTISGAAAGQVLRALGATTAAFDVLQHADLGGVTANQHHNQIHSITGADHTITGSAFQLVGATASNTLGLLTPSSSPGAAAAILRTDANGSLFLDTALFVVNALTNLVTIDTNLLYADAPNNRIGINQTPGNAALDVLSAANADHTLRVKQKSGQTGRLWRVEDTSGNELIVLDSQGNLQSGNPGFTSGLTGWQIQPNGTAEFNNVWVRGELHATVFVKDEIHATGGTFFVATAGKMYADADIDSTTKDTLYLTVETTDGIKRLTIETTAGTQNLQVEAIYNYIDVEDPPSGAGFYFDEGDILRSKTEVDTGVTDFWLEVISAQQLDGYSRYSVIKQSGTDGTLPAGAAVVSYGVEGDGRILMTSDLNFAPYLDVFTVGPDPWTGDAGAIIPHVRLGRLDGVGVTGTSGIEQYGMIAGTDLSDANSPHIIVSNLGLRLFKVDLTLNDGTNDTGEWDSDGNLTIGSNIANTDGKSFQVITTGDGAGDVIIGRLAGNHLHWDDDAGTLNIDGALAVGGADVATVTYADQAEADAITAAATDATTKANAAQAAAIAAAATDATTKADSAQSAAISAAAADATTKADAAQAIADAAQADADAAQAAADAAQTDATQGLADAAQAIADAAQAAADAAQAYADAYADAQAYGNARRIVGISGTFTIDDANTVSWGNPTNVVVRFGGGASKTISDGNTGNMAALTYLYVDATAASPLTMLTTTAIGDIGTDHALIAVCAPGADKASARIVAGATFITGDNIVTGSIVAANIKGATITGDKLVANTITANEIAANAITASEILAGAVTATKISVTSLSSIQANVGQLSIGSSDSGYIRTGTKGYFDSNAGIWMGYNAGAYKMDITGSDGDTLLFNGASLSILTTNSLKIQRLAGGVMIEMTSSAGTGQLSWNSPNFALNGGLVASGIGEFDTRVVIKGHALVIEDDLIAASVVSAGDTGEIRWGEDGGVYYLYLYTGGAAGWRRAQLSGW